MIVKVLKIPVRYAGVTYPAGQFFDMEEAHFDESIVGEATAEEAEEEMAKYSKAADRSVKSVEPAKSDQVKDEKVVTPVEKTDDYKTFSRSKLEGIKNDDLKTYLDSKNIKYEDDAEKKDFIALIFGE